MGKMVHKGRFMAQSGENFVVFIIGMRVNKWWAIHQWWPVFKAMPAMLKELYTHKESGFRSLEMTVNFRTILLVQYWRSFEDLKAYARGPIHLKAWKHFYQKVSESNAVGIYHETYQISSGNYECLYANMPVFGLAKAIGHKEITPQNQSAEKRMNA
ncbi:DUF4188 domain-containing protein [Bacillus litorisediminis]|uniref:DUF4188 domain-containing protein n=1 Tax=Bacillus litorisediminis TaxID=2922713 RepID=UPI0036F38E27